MEDQYDLLHLRYAKMTEWMDNVEMAIAKVEIFLNNIFCTFIIILSIHISLVVYPVVHRFSLEYSYVSYCVCLYLGNLKIKECFGKVFNEGEEGALP